MSFGTTCAIVVTYNRIGLLLECIDHLKNQKTKIDKILIVDNASTDNTEKLVKDKHPDVELLKLEYNMGGAGGFYRGIEWAHKNGYEWLWILDDDTIAEENALFELINSYEAFPDNNKPVMLSSRVNWIDNTLHSMNLPTIKTTNFEEISLAAVNSTISIRATSFVSLLLNSKMVTLYGLPYKEYFIWNDDYEYTARILKENFGVLNPRSLVTHKTKFNYVPVESSGDRYYFEIRNKLWLLKTNSFHKKEKLKIFLNIIRGIIKYLKTNKGKPRFIKVILKGIIHGLFPKNK